MESTQSLTHEDLVNRDFRRNVTAFVAFEFLWGLGLPFALFVVFVPSYLNLILAPKLIIGLTASLGAILMPLQLLADRFVGGPGRKRRVWIIYSCTAISYLLYGTLASFLPDKPNTWRIAFFFLAMVAFIGTINLAQPAYWSMLTDNCPLRRRGRLLGFRTTGLGLGGLINIVPARWVYQHWPSPTNYHVAILIAGSFFIVACLSVLFIRDHIDPESLESRDKRNGTPLIRDIFQLLARLWRTPNYRVFIFFIIVLAASASLAPYLVTYAGDCLGMFPEQNRLFNIAYLITCPLAGLSIGILADRWGYRLPAIFAGVFACATFIMAISAQNAQTILLAYCLYCCIVVTLPTILCNMSVELMPQESPASLIAAGNMFTLIPTLLTSALCGRIIDIYRSLDHVGSGYLIVFTVAIVLAVLGGLGMLFLVQEPRSGRIYVIKILDRQ